MESDSRTRSKKVIQILETFIPLLNATDDSESHAYALYFAKVLIELNRPHNLYKIAEKLDKLFAGMGSFDEIILCKNLKILDKEQDEFVILKHELFELCQDVIIEQRGGLTIQDFDGEYFIPIERVKEIKRLQNIRRDNQKNDLDNDSE